MWTHILQIVIYEFVLIYDRQTAKTLLSFEEGASPLSPGTRECVRLVPKNWDADAWNLRHRLVGFRVCTRTPSEIWDLYKSISMPCSQPLFSLVHEILSGGHALEKNQAMLKHHEGHFWCFNVANMNDSIVRGYGNPPMISPILKWLQSALRGGQKSKTGEARFLVRGLAISPH